MCKRYLRQLPSNFFQIVLAQFILQKPDSKPEEEDTDKRRYLFENSLHTFKNKFSYSGFLLLNDMYKSAVKLPLTGTLFWIKYGSGAWNGSTCPSSQRLLSFRSSKTIA